MIEEENEQRQEDANNRTKVAVTFSLPIDVAALIRTNAVLKQRTISAELLAALGHYIAHYSDSKPAVLPTVFWTDKAMAESEKPVEAVEAASEDHA